MKGLVAALSLLALPAAADPPRCAATGHVVYEEDSGNIENDPPVDTRLKVYASGAWTYADVDRRGAVVDHGEGCLDEDAMRRVRALRDVSWALAWKQRGCMWNGNFTSYLVDGKLRWSYRPCENIGAKTLAAIADVHAILKSANVHACEGLPCSVELDSRP